MEKDQKPYKNSVSKGGHPKMWKSKKNRFLAKNAWHYLCQEGRKKRAFSCTLSVLAKFFGDQNSVNQEKL